MKLQTRFLTVVPGLLAATCMTSYAGVTLTVDSTTTQASTSWGASPAGPLAQSISTPSSQNSFDGGVSSGVIFKAGSSFVLGAAELDLNGYSGTGATGNFNLFLLDLGSSYSLPAASPVYTFTGSEVNLFSAGLNVTVANASQFNVLTFSGADNVSINSGDSYWLGLVASDGVSNLGWHRGPITPNQDIAVNSGVVGGAGTVLNNGGTGANRTPVAALFAVPEPSSLALAGVGMAALLAYRRRNA